MPVTGRIKHHRRPFPAKTGPICQKKRHFSGKTFTVCGKTFILLAGPFTRPPKSFIVSRKAFTVCQLGSRLSGKGLIARYGRSILSQKNSIGGDNPFTARHERFNRHSDGSIGCHRTESQRRGTFALHGEPFALAHKPFAFFPDPSPER